MDWLGKVYTSGPDGFWYQAETRDLDDKTLINASHSQDFHANVLIGQFNLLEFIQ